MEGAAIAILVSELTVTLLPVHQLHLEWRALLRGDILKREDVSGGRWERVKCNRRGRIHTSMFYMEQNTHITGIIRMCILGVWETIDTESKWQMFSEI